MARPSPLDVYGQLDKSNCGDCGYETCMAFATDLLERKIRLEDCTHLMQDPKQKKNLKKLREMLRPPQRPVRLGVGENEVTIGGEEVLMRHQLTYYNETAIFVQVPDTQEDLEDQVKYLDDLSIERMGEVLEIQGIALRCVSKDANTFKEAAKKTAEITDLPIMLCCLEPEFLIGAAEEIKDKKPALYTATKDTWEEIGTFAVKNELPIVVSSPTGDLDELMSLSATLQKLGSKQIILDPGTFFGPGGISETYNNLSQLRISGIKNENENAGWPIMGVPAAYWTQTEKFGEELWRDKFQEVIMASVLISEATSLIVVNTGKEYDDIWALLALMTLRQSIYSDPRIYPAVDEGIYEVGEPGEDAPIFVTSNYRLTKIPVEIDIKGANLDAYLLVSDSEGIGIESAVAGGQFSAGSIAETVKGTGIFDKVNHRILIIPGMAARLSGALEDEADCFVLVGPRDSSGIGSFMDKKWTPDEYMKQYNERGE
ncbi:MAG: acetyl-CoA decarbonylase/synthase complex subunit gamma [Promethearchaeota archaeon]|nr:MAG: acetyl-CoA decarbonylase/synthase complex subunit gamma [Candidatus Lokiarchaeota archaeon]